MVRAGGLKSWDTPTHKRPQGICRLIHVTVNPGSQPPGQYTMTSFKDDDDDDDDDDAMHAC